jgi:hypothetical protein
MRTPALALAAVAVISVTLKVTAQGAPVPAVPLDANPAIVDSFRSHAVVAVSDGREHGDREGHAFIVSLVRDPRFAAIADDIVVECCNALYQDRVDRFVRGEEISSDALAELWRNTTQVNAGQRDCRFCEELFRAVRTENASRPRDRQLRVLLGDPPIDWDAVHTHEDYARWIALRDSVPADLIRREVLAKGRRALVVYGGMHLQRKNLLANYESEGPAETLVSRLESTTGTRAFSIWAATKLETRQPDVASWRAPALTVVRGTVLGAADFADYYEHPVRRLAIKDGKPDFANAVARDEWRRLRMDDQFDAVLYLGPTLTADIPLSPDMCVATGYMKTLRERMTLVGLTPEIDRLRKYCDGK